MLVSAFAGTARMKRAYTHAIDAGYRFYSYGDSSFLHRSEDSPVRILANSYRWPCSPRLTTAHGKVETPVFMPVGTAATVKGMTSDAISATGADIILANTYHLMLRPGAERVNRLGGLHEFMDWRKPILT